MSYRILRSRPFRPATPATAVAGAFRLAWLSLLSIALATSTSAQAPPTSQQPTPVDVTADAGFQVVVNAENPATELAAAMVAKMFLKKLKRWDHGVLVLPIDLGAQSPVRDAFTKAVHGKSVTAINSYWQRMIFSGRGVPPPEEPSEEAVLADVRANPGAIGYVGPETALGDGVKRLKVTP